MKRRFFIGSGKEVQPECILQMERPERLNSLCSRSPDLTGTSLTVPRTGKIAALAAFTAPHGNTSFVFSLNVRIVPANGRGKQIGAWTDRR